MTYIIDRRALNSSFSFVTGFFAIKCYMSYGQLMFNVQRSMFKESAS
jgi:hypothetical protein